MPTKRTGKLISSESVKNTAAETRNLKRDAALKAINAEAALEEAQARSDDAPKIARIESVSPERIHAVNFEAEDKPHAPLGADEFGMPIRPVPTKVVLVVPIPEADADLASAPEVSAPVEASTVDVVSENSLIEGLATKPEKLVKKVKAVKAESTPKPITDPKADTGTFTGLGKLSPESLGYRYGRDQQEDGFKHQTPVSGTIKASPGNDLDLCD